MPEIDIKDFTRAYSEFYMNRKSDMLIHVLVVLHERCIQRDGGIVKKNRKR